MDAFTFVVIVLAWVTVVLFGIVIVRAYQNVQFAKFDQQARIRAHMSRVRNAKKTRRSSSKQEEDDDEEEVMDLHPLAQGLLKGFAQSRGVDFERAFIDGDPNELRKLQQAGTTESQPVAGDIL